MCWCDTVTVLKGELLALRPKGGSLFQKKLNLDIASKLPELAIRKDICHSDFFFLYTNSSDAELSIESEVSTTASGEY